MAHHLQLIDNVCISTPILVRRVISCVQPQASRDHVPTKPIFTFNDHKDEGFALDWSPVMPFRLATGDLKKGIHVWERHEAGTWVVSPKALKGHTDSVEDIQWSPSEAHVSLVS